MYKNNFVLTVLRDNLPQKEFEGKISLPFDTEYKIRLRNKNCRRSMAKVFIDGVQVCGLGDFVIGPGSLLDLERFVDDSLTRGKKFKFVSLDHSEVDDPTNSENGIVRVEFRLEKQMPWVCFDTSKISMEPFPYGTGNFKSFESVYWYNMDSSGEKLCNDGYAVDPLSYSFNNSTGSSEIQAGATVGGRVSNQQFIYANDFEVEDTPTILTLKLVSSKDLNNKKAVSAKISVGKGRYCAACGRKVKFHHTYCSNCGSKLG